jgi:hypothetical protein
MCQVWKGLSPVSKMLHQHRCKIEKTFIHVIFYCGLKDGNICKFLFSFNVNELQANMPTWCVAHFHVTVLPWGGFGWVGQGLSWNHDKVHMQVNTQLMFRRSVMLIRLWVMGIHFMLLHIGTCIFEEHNFMDIILGFTWQISFTWFPGHRCNSCQKRLHFTLCWESGWGLKKLCQLRNRRTRVKQTTCDSKLNIKHAAKWTHCITEWNAGKIESVSHVFSTRWLCFAPFSGWSNHLEHL